MNDAANGGTRFGWSSCSSSKVTSSSGLGNDVMRIAIGPPDDFADLIENPTKEEGNLVENSSFRVKLCLGRTAVVVLGMPKASTAQRIPTTHQIMTPA